MQQPNIVMLAFGSNEASAWGPPAAAVRRSFAELDAAGVVLRRISDLIVTQPVGPVAQADYVNAVARAETKMDAATLLALLKRLEWQAGRRPGPRWGPRPLDIDILDFGGMVVGWDAPHDPMRPAPLVLPHPELHKRAFVLAPLAEIAGDWRHPVLGLTPVEMLAALVQPPRL